MRTTLLLVRHGEPDWDSVGNDVRQDPSLTALGREQAKCVGQWLKANYTIDTHYASTMARARETAEIANEYLQLPVALIEEFREWPQPGGVITVLPKSEQPFQLEDPLGRHAYEKLPPEYWGFAERIFQRLRVVVEKHWDETILIVCHGGVISTIVRSLLGGHRMPFHFDFTGVSHIFWEDGFWVVGYLNRREHLLP